MSLQSKPRRSRQILEGGEGEEDTHKNTVKLPKPKRECASRRIEDLIILVHVTEQRREIINVNEKLYC